MRGEGAPGLARTAQGAPRLRWAQASRKKQGNAAICIGRARASPQATWRSPSAIARLRAPRARQSSSHQHRRRRQREVEITPPSPVQRRRGSDVNVFHGSICIAQVETPRVARPPEDTELLGEAFWSSASASSTDVSPREPRQAARTIVQRFSFSSAILDVLISIVASLSGSWRLKFSTVPKYRSSRGLTCFCWR